MSSEKNGADKTDPVTKILISLTFFIASLTALVILAGILRNNIDLTAMGTALVGLQTGIVGGLLLRKKGGGNDDA